VKEIIDIVFVDSRLLLPEELAHKASPVLLLGVLPIARLTFHIRVSRLE
jgi:hypothetical protein